MSGPALIAGFDAGQTHTTCRLVREGTVLAEGEGPGVRHLAAPGGEQAFGDALRQSLAQAGAAAGLPAPLRLDAAAIGASGIEVGTPVQQRGRQLAAATLQLPLARVAVTGDERTALRGAMGSHGEGLVLISGTGTIAVGRNRLGREHRCAGWGWLLDGAGSAMDIGRDGLARSLEMADGRRPESGLRQRLWQQLGIDSHAPGAAQALKALVVQPDFGPAGFARLAPLVVAAAEAGDPEARGIVAHNAAALAAMAVTICRELELSCPLIWPMGGALEHLPALRRRLEEALGQRLPGASLAVPAGDACAGALTMAAELLRPPPGAGAPEGRNSLS
ncbi:MULTISPECIES: N-acetylglucosamine kinase [Aphanothece]|uniref:N-acetylglucosamine kinase n=1 Tax=Aphanothece TaxID=1121 RepID=UPI0039849E4E